MFNLFTTREIAIGIYIILLIVFCFASNKFRGAALDVVKACANKYFIITFIVIGSVASLFVFFIEHLQFWKWAYLKDIVIWILFAGLPSCLNAADIHEKHYFKNSIITNITLSAMLAFFMGTFTFPLYIELILQPIVFFLSTAQIVARQDENTIIVSKITGIILSIMGIILFFLTVKTALAEYHNHTVSDYIISFMTPLVFSLLYLPIMYFIAIYSKYEIIFLRMNFLIQDRKKKRRIHHLKVFMACKLSYSYICSFEKTVNRFYDSIDDNQFDKLINQFKSEQKNSLNNNS